MRGNQRTLYQIGEKMRGWNVLERLQDLKDMEHWTNDQIQAFKLDSLKRILHHAYQNVPFYKELWNRANVHPDQVTRLEDLSAFPKVSKKILVEAGDLALDQTRPKSSFVEGRSSGSTGERFVYYKSKEHQSWFIAGAMHGWTWAGWEPGDRWIRLQFRGHLSWRARIEDRMFRCLYMPIDQLDDEFLDEFSEKAIRFQPVMIRGYAGGTYVFARFLRENQVTQLRPKVVVCTGDTLYPHYRETIEKAFQRPVFDMYGGEGMPVANQCSQGLYHILPIVHVEIEPDALNIDGGQAGSLLLTSLTNYAMPMIRYDIRDFGVLNRTGCKCGREWPSLQKIIGRETDIIVTPSGRHLVCHHFNNILREVDGVDQFQILQAEANRITLLIQKNESYDKNVHEPYILRQLELLGGKNFKTYIEYPDTIPMRPTGKRRYIISSFAETELR